MDEVKEQNPAAQEPSVPVAEGVVPAVEGAPTEGAPIRKAKVRGVRVGPLGLAHIRATFNNTVVSITDVRGNVVAWSSAGRAGFKGSRKSTAFAATVVGQDAAGAAAARGISEVEVRVQGAGSGRESAVRALQTSGLAVTMIKDMTPIPHNGCRPRKRRRV
jgi:small subunit ribosomal protein S11